MTFRRDGTAVATPVWFVADGGTLLVWTGESTWKVKAAAPRPSRRGGDL
jgi:PPOX class probable F420-dependent enzyme